RVSATSPARGRARGDAARGPGTALTARSAERGRDGRTTRDRASGRKDGRYTGAFPGAAGRGCGDCRSGLVGPRSAEMVTPPGARDRPDAGRPGRSRRSPSSPASLLSVAGGHRRRYNRNSMPVLRTVRVFAMSENHTTVTVQRCLDALAAETPA